MKAERSVRRALVLSGLLALLLSACLPSADLPRADPPRPSVVAGVAAPAPRLDAGGIAAALEASRQNATPCLELMEEDSWEFRQCINFKAEPPPASEAQLPAAELHTRQLGTLYFGWFYADLADAHGVGNAEKDARELLQQWLPMQALLAVSDEQLCAMIPAPCARIRARMHEAARQLQQNQALPPR